MADERYSFSQARTRLEEIVTQVRKKDTSLEKSLDLLEEGVRLANVCTELSDHTEWRTVVEEQAAQVDSSAGDAETGVVGDASALSAEESHPDDESSQSTDLPDAGTEPA